MDSAKIWNRIVKHYKDNYSAKEEVIQKDWEQIFSDLFNYSRLFGEIDAHRNIHIGSHQRTIPDIIITSENGDLFDVELKQYNMPFSVDMENQLKSYMDLLHITVGVPPKVRVHGSLKALDYPTLTSEDAEGLLLPILDEKCKRKVNFYVTERTWAVLS